MFLIVARETLQVWSLAVVATFLVVVSLTFPPLWGLAIPVILLLLMEIWEFVFVTLPVLRERQQYRAKHGDA